MGNQLSNTQKVCLSIIILLGMVVYSSIKSCNRIININDNDAIDITQKAYNYHDFCSNNEFEKAHQVVDALYSQFVSAHQKDGEYDSDYASRKTRYYAQYHDALNYESTLKSPGLD